MSYRGDLVLLFFLSNFCQKYFSKIIHFLIKKNSLSINLGKGKKKNKANTQKEKGNGTY